MPQWRAGSIPVICRNVENSGFSPLFLFLSKIIKIWVNSDNSQTNGRNSYSHNVTPIWEPIYRPADFGNLNDKIVIVADGKYIEADKCRCYEDKANIQANKQDESQTITIKYIIDKIFKRAE